MFFRTLSGRFLMLTIIFVMLAEILIFVPSVARYREDYLLARLERAQIASLSLLASPGFIEENLAQELLENAGVFNVVLRRDAVRELVLSSPLPQPVSATFDLRDPGALALMRDAMAVLFDPENRVIRVIGDPVREAGLLIEVTLETGPLRAEMLEYGERILWLSLVISVSTAVLLFAAVQLLMVAPIRQLVRAMSRYAEAPEDGRRIITPTARVRELREAEDALHDLQTQLTANLRQKERLAQLGGAVARISHDLRNILSSASLFADRMETSQDPAVRRAAPKLLNSLSRAINLCENTLAFGKAEEPPPSLNRIALAPLVKDVVANEELAASGTPEIEFLVDVPPGLNLSADSEQLFRVLTNLIRNARQAIEATGQPGSIEVSAKAGDGNVVIGIGDTGPGLPAKARDNLFTAFQGGVRKGGVGLGLVIAAELVRGHGGRLELHRSDDQGTEFRIILPTGI
ncbi:sensor histidine kinase [Rhodobacteraceae bacterium 2376]|uniref:histidine kinase n=1 Tax=Rhabdonatronobacter sediminivivens TaxID=2743469 RepID=A0A7Z0HYZ6_9RHOB|nr:HAMP domain-containing sensor histidine kinase [Rhabdonatronobacter sediminivivens]NYS24886.1 sensor histidine kinase [Rhabdonatronobacter sediminivivens]